MGKVIHFEIPASDVERAKKFYSEVFGWHMNPMPDLNYTIVHTGPTDDVNGMLKESGFINGGISTNTSTIKAPSFAIDVEDLTKAMKQVKTAGGELLTDKMNVGDMGIMAYFKDPDGNILSLWQNVKK